MAFRPTRFLIEGALDNSVPNKVTGWMKFVGIKEKMTLDLEGNFHRDIRGAKIHFTGDAHEDQADANSEGYFESIALHQTGKVGDITAGLPPADYITGSVYIEWYSNENGRVVLELEQDQLQLLSRPIPACESDPISREEQNRNMTEFLGGLRTVT